MRKPSDVLLPQVVNKWTGPNDVFRLVWTGVTFEIQNGDDYKGYEKIDDTEAFNTLASILLMDLDEVPEGVSIRFGQNEFGQIVSSSIESESFSK